MGGGWQVGVAAVSSGCYLAGDSQPLPLPRLQQRVCEDTGFGKVEGTLSPGLRTSGFRYNGSSSLLMPRVRLATADVVPVGVNAAAATWAAVAAWTWDSFLCACDLPRVPPSFLKIVFIIFQTK